MYVALDELRPAQVTAEVVLPKNLRVPEFTMVSLVALPATRSLTGAASLPLPIFRVAPLFIVSAPAAVEETVVVSVSIVMAPAITSL